MTKPLRDYYIYKSFFARDKASVAQIIADADKEGDEHEEPDGDEGKQAIVIHNHHNEGTDDDDDDDFRKKTEDSLKELRDSLAKLTDMLTTRATAKDADGDDDEKKDGDEEKKDDEDDTKDGDPLATGEGALTGTAPPSAEPDLMEADPALKTGPSMMGDATFTARVNSAMGHVIRDTKARAEILAPGLKIGILDGAAGPDRMKQAGKRLFDTRRAALLSAAGNERGMVAIGRHTADQIKAMSPDAVKMLFVDASERMRQINNAANRPSPQFGEMKRASNDSMKARIENMNKRNAEFWAANGGTGRRVGTGG